jgi:hypothetical protein
MSADNDIKYLQERMESKKINAETQDYVIQYVKMNEALFGKYIDKEKLIKRIINNLDSSIYGIEGINGLKSIRRKLKMAFNMRRKNLGGIYKGYQMRIEINPMLKLKGEERVWSTIMHELDHCATTEYVKLDEYDAYDYKDIYQMCKIHNDILVVSGVDDPREKVDSNVSLRRLNEGITVYKQKIYNQYTGNKSETQYKTESEVAEFIANTIGKENLITLHFNNDYKTIKEKFYQKTGQDLNELLDVLNNKSRLKRRIFGKLYIKKYEKNVKNVMQKMKQKKAEKKSKKNANFVDRYVIDESCVINLQQEKLNEDKIIQREK